MTVAQLVAAGCTRDDISYRAKVGRLHRVHRGVYAVGHTALTPHGRYLAAALALGEGAAVDGWPAAWLHGLIDRAPARPEVVVGRRTRPRDEIRLRYAASFESTRQHCVPVLTVAATLVALATRPQTPDDRLRRLVRQAQVLRRAPHAKLVAAAHTAPSRARRRLLTLLDAHPVPTRSEAEDLLHALLDENRFPPHETNFEVEGEEADVFFPGLNLVVELDSRAFHDVSSVALNDDRRKQAIWEAAGLRVIRLTYTQLTNEKERTLARLRQATAAAAASASSS